MLLVLVLGHFATVQLTNADNGRTIPVAVGTHITIALSGETPNGLDYTSLDFEGFAIEGGSLVCTPRGVSSSLSMSCLAVSPGMARVYPRFHDLSMLWSVRVLVI